MQNLQGAENFLKVFNEEVVDDEIPYQSPELDIKSIQTKYEEDQHYFKEVRVSLVCVLRMLNHSYQAVKGDRASDKEVMGYLFGAVRENIFYIQDTIQLAASASETSVMMNNETASQESTYGESKDKVRRTNEFTIGWYHSHPGLTAYFSQTDVESQKIFQQVRQDLGVGLVIDPLTTLSNNKIHLGAFRNYFKPTQAKEIYKPTLDVIKKNLENLVGNKPVDGLEAVQKILGGNQYDQYYPLKITFYKSKLDEKIINILLNKYWSNTLVKSPLFIDSALFCKKFNELVMKQKDQNQIGYQDKNKKGVEELSSRGANMGLTQFTLDSQLATLTENNKALIFNIRF